MAADLADVLDRCVGLLAELRDIDAGHPDGPCLTRV